MARQGPARQGKEFTIMKTAVAMFEGQGGWVFSQGVFSLRDKLRQLGARVDVYRYVDETLAHPMLNRYQDAGYAVALWGYSLGTSEALYEQSHRKVDLLMCCAVSTLEVVYPVAKTTARSVLWTAGGVLSSGGTNLGFQKVTKIWVPPIPILGHLLTQVHPTVVRDTVDEVAKLLGREVAAPQAAVPPPPKAPPPRRVGVGLKT